MGKNGSKPNASTFKHNPASRMGRGVGAGNGASTPSGLGDLHLRTFDDDGESPAPAGTRLVDVSAAIGVYVQLRKADEKSARQRALVDAMFDGAPPYDAAKLFASGQQDKTNVNFGQGARILDIALSAYVDLYSSLETYVEVHSKFPEMDDETFAKQTIVAEELSEVLREWPEFHSHYLRLCSTFTKHGVGIAYFDNPSTFRFRVGGFDDILIPRQTPASEEMISVAVAPTRYQVHELFAFIKNPEVAKKSGWNPEEVIRVLNQNVTTVGVSGNRSSTSGYGFEDWQATLKNNDIYLGIENPSVSVLHFWVRETDGSVSHMMCAEHSPQDFLYKKPKRFDSPTQAYVFFTNGVGSNGTFHSVRGLGQRIQAHVQILNKMRCHGIDGAMMGSALMIQPLNQRGIDELEFSYYGAYAVLSPDAQIVDKALPNMDKVLKPVMDDITDQLLQNTDTVTTYGPDRGSPYRNQMQVASDLEVTSRISGSSINLFYQAWDKLMREVTRRIVTGDERKDPLIKKFFSACADRGVTKEFIATLDLDRTEATRSVGDGSAANRMMVQKELAAMSGQFDEIGQKNLTHDMVANLVGHKMANRYAPAPSKTNGTERDSVDTKIAILENSKLEQGQEIPPLSSEMHGKHLRQHIPLAQNLLTGIEEGQVDPVAVLPVLSVVYFHLSDTAAMASANPNLEAAVMETNQILQLLEEQINNAQKAEAKMMRDQMEAEAAAAEEAQREAQMQPELEIGTAGQPVDAAADPKVSDAARMSDIKVRNAELDMEITRRKAALDMKIRQEQHEQKVALEDAKVAAKVRNETALREAKGGTGVGAIGR